MFDLTRPAEWDPTDSTGTEERIVEGAGQMAAFQCRWLQEIASVDMTQGEAQTFYSKASWLSWRCSMHIRTAAEYVKVAERLSDLPLVTADFAKGQLSWSQVKLLARVATPDTEQVLLDIARVSTVGQLARVVGAYRSVLEAEANAANSRLRRSLNIWFDDQGFCVLRGRLPAEDGAVLETALRRVMDSMPVPSPRRAGLSDPPGDVMDHHGARMADALTQMAREHLVSVTTDQQAGTTIPEVILHVDLESLRGETGEECHLENGVALAPSTALRICCDAALVPLLEDGAGNPLSIGRRSRVIPRGMRRALRARDKGCRFPGCPGKRYIERHHAEHWAHGGPTSMENVLELCHFHHTLVHEGGYSVRSSDDGFTFYRPNGSVVPTVLEPGPESSGDLRSENRRLGVDVEPGAICSGWDGERMNLGWVIDAVVDSWENGPPQWPD